MIWCYTIVSVVIVSLASFIGVIALSSNSSGIQQFIFVTVGLAVGAMFGDTFIHLLPQAFSATQSSLATSLLVILGILAFFLLEKFLLWRHEHIPHYGECIHPVGYVSLVADGLHNFIDGLLIGSSFLVSIPVGVGTTLAVLLHEIPQEIGDFGVLLHAGFRPAKAIWLNFLSATAAILGAVLALLIGGSVKSFPEIALPITAGGFIYIAGSDLVPEMHKERAPAKSAMQLIAIVLGVGLMVLLKLVE